MGNGVARRLPLIAAGAAGLGLVAAFWPPAASVDEAATIVVIRQPWSRVLDVFRYDAALEPYYVLMKAWSAVSTATWWLRIPSLLAGIAAVALVVRLVREATDVLTAAL